MGFNLVFKGLSVNIILTNPVLRNNPHLNGDELLTPRPNLKLEDHPLSAVPNTLFNKFVLF